MTQAMLRNVPAIGRTASHSWWVSRSRVSTNPSVALLPDDPVHARAPKRARDRAVHQGPVRAAQRGPSIAQRGRLLGRRTRGRRAEQCGLGRARTVGRL